MSGLRIRQEIFIPEDPDGVFVSQLGIKLPSEVAQYLPAYVKETRRIKKYAAKINEGQPNEEMTVKAKWHICYHNEGMIHSPCGEEQDI